MKGEHPFLEKINGGHWLVRENGSIYKMTARSDSGFSRRRDNNSRTERSFAKELEWEIRGFDNESPKVARNVTVTVRNCKRAVSGQNLKAKRAC